MSFRDKTSAALRDVFESNGEEGTVQIVRETLEKKELAPEDYSIQEIWHAFERNPDGSIRGYHEAVSTSIFPKITGELINSKLIEAYSTVPTIGGQITTVMSSNMEVDTIAGFDASEGPEPVEQGASYNDSGMGEKSVTIPHQKYGRLISVTEEMVFFDKTGQILMRAQGIGEQAAQEKEKQIVEGVQDINSDVFRPSGVAAAFYRTAVSGIRRINSRASTPFGEEGLLQTNKLMHAMTDENGNYITVNPGRLILLAPYDLWVQAIQMQKSTLVPESGENAINIWKGSFTPLTSPWITAQSDTTWYLGDFKRDFVWSEIWPLQTFSLPLGGEDGFRKDIKSLFKVRFYGQVGAIDDKRCFKLTI